MEVNARTAISQPVKENIPNNTIINDKVPRFCENNNTFGDNMEEDTNHIRDNEKPDE